MIVQLGLLLVTYVGSKVYDTLKLQLKQAEQGPVTVPEPSLEIAAPAPAAPEATETKEQMEQRQARYLKASVASMGFFAARHFIPSALPLGIAAYLYSCIPYMRDVERALIRDKKVNVDVLFFVADVLTFGTRQYFAAALGLGMIHHGKLMVRRARDDSAKMVTHLFKELPQSVWMLREGVEVEAPLDAVRAGDIIIIGSGGVIPVDGVIQEGVAQINQQALTGEGQPAEKGTGDPVFANTIVIAGRLLIRVDRSGADTTSAQIADMLLKSVSFKSGVQLKGEKWADQLSMPMLVSAMALLPFIGPSSAAVFINSHIGARILLFAPLATLRHISEASQMGVLVKDGRALEQLGDVDTILFDKTGTLTTDEPEVKRVIARTKYTTKEILGFAATAERKLAHPIARAILKKAQAEAVPLHDIEDSSYTIGYGVSVTINGQLIRVGSVRFFGEQGIKLPREVALQQEEAQALGNTFILVGVNQTVAGALELQPQVRPEIREIIAKLRAYGIRHMGIVSGDDQAPTKKLAEDLGMDEHFHNVLPEDKARIVEEMRAKGKVVCFIGDGINDTIALKRANVSMSISGATSIAKDMADIIFMDGTLNHLVGVVELSRRLDVNLRRCWLLCLAPSAVNLMGAFVFKYNILTSLLVNNAFAAIGVSKAYYMKKKDPDEAEEPASRRITPATVAKTAARLSFPGPKLLPASSLVAAVK